MPQDAPPHGPAERLLRLIDRLAETTDSTTSSLASDLGVTRRTINRDISLLSKAGLEIIREKPTGILRLGRETFLPSIDLTIDEALTLITAYRSLSDQSGIPGLAQLSLIADKVADALPRSLREYLPRLQQSLTIALPPVSQRDRASAWYRLFQDAITRRCVVEMHYDSIWDQQAIVTRLKPAFLTFRRRCWYCIGESSFHREVRTFHLGRVIIARLSSETFSDDNRPTPESRFKNAWNMIPGPERHIVRIHFSRLVARNVADVRWHHTQQIQWQADDSIIFSAEVDGLNEIVWWILGYGDQAEVLEPPELRQKLLVHAESIASKYRSSEA